MYELNCTTSAQDPYASGVMLRVSKGGNTRAIAAAATPRATFAPAFFRIRNRFSSLTRLAGRADSEIILLQAALQLALQVPSSSDQHSAKSDVAMGTLRSKHHLPDGMSAICQRVEA